MSVVDWTQRAACRDIDPEVFFPLGDIDTGPRTYELAWRAALTYCAQCPVLRECHERAERTASVGVWHGAWRAYGAVPLPLIPAAGGLASSRRRCA